jgi:hypothetical protein
MTIDPRCDGDFNEDEWLAQERGLSLERRGAPSRAGSARERRYRLLARTLAEQPDAHLSPDFAAMVAHEARTLRAVEDAREQRFEKRLIAAMWIILALAVATSALFYSDELIAALRLRQYGASLDTPWLFALLACMGISCVAQWLPLELFRRNTRA